MDDSTQAGYRVLPQSDDEQRQDEEELQQPSPEVHVSRKIWWIHFVFGCAVLLPWNGECSETVNAGVVMNVFLEL